MARVWRVVYQTLEVGKLLTVRRDFVRLAQRSMALVVRKAKGRLVRPCAGTKTHFDDLASHAARGIGGHE
ncbi:unannotated protein [freshwater metagenome]|jgi:hypothetical protein|uniref:Unannotated protein n=1 Tax=freshwater metagenome TaxID=449393 RepID=A0A6J6ARH3_9ZZZZ